MTEHYCTNCNCVISHITADDNGDLCDDCKYLLDLIEEDKRTDFTSEDWT